MRGRSSSFRESSVRRSAARADEQWCICLRTRRRVANVRKSTPPVSKASRVHSGKNAASAQSHSQTSERQVARAVSGRVAPGRASSPHGGDGVGGATVVGGRRADVGRRESLRSSRISSRSLKRVAVRATQSSDMRWLDQRRGLDQPTQHAVLVQQRCKIADHRSKRDLGRSRRATQLLDRNQRASRACAVAPC